MDNDLRSNLLTVCKLLSKHKVEYLVVGGAAVALYGYFRISITSMGNYAEKPDIDLWYNPSYPNYFNLLKVIEELGQDISFFKKERTPEPRKSFFKLDFESMTIDFIPELPGLDKFKDSFAKNETVEVEGQTIFFIGIDDLIANKEALSREKDMTDVEELKKRARK